MGIWQKRNRVYPWRVNCKKNKMNHEYPWEDVEASRRNRRLQKRHQLPEGIETHFSDAGPCPKCQTPPDALSWFYFESPKETWKMLCGTAGWMVVCDRCKKQVGYFEEVIS